MNQESTKTAVIVGVGNGLSYSLAELLHRNDYQLILAARNIEKLKPLINAVNATAVACDATSVEDVQRTFAQAPGPIRVVVCNPSAGPQGNFVDLDPNVVSAAIQVTAFASFLVAQQAVKHMLKLQPVNGSRGTIILTGASAGVKGFPRSAPFAMGKFAQRGLAQSLSRELHPHGIHVCWVNIDGGIANSARGREQTENNPNALLEPTAVAQTYLDIVNQHPSAWSSEIAIRPWVEPF